MYSIFIQFLFRFSHFSYQNFIAIFRDDVNGHALWIEKVQPFWISENQHKIICSSLDAPQIAGLISMCSPDTIHDIGLRVIEIFPSILSDLGVSAVVELVHRQKWVHIVRFVVTDISSLCQLMTREVVVSSNVDGPKKKRSLTQSVEVPVLVRIYDETVRKSSYFNFCVLFRFCLIFNLFRNGMLCAIYGRIVILEFVSHFSM